MGTPLDKEGYGWVAEGGDAFCAMLQAAAAKAAKSTVSKRVFITNVKGTFLGMSESEEASKRR